MMDTCWMVMWDWRYKGEHEPACAFIWLDTDKADGREKSVYESLFFGSVNYVF